MEGKEIKTRNEETEGTRTRTTTTTRMFRKSLFTKRNSVVSMLSPENVRTVRDVRYISLFLSLFTNLQYTPINKYSSHTERAIFEEGRFVIRNTRLKDARRTGIKDSALTEADACSFMMKVQMRLRLSRREISQERLLEI